MMDGVPTLTLGLDLKTYWFLHNKNHIHFYNFMIFNHDFIYVLTFH